MASPDLFIMEEDHDIDVYIADMLNYVTSTLDTEDNTWKRSKDGRSRFQKNQITKSRSVDLIAENSYLDEYERTEVNFDGQDKAPYAERDPRSAEERKDGAQLRTSLTNFFGPGVPQTISDPEDDIVYLPEDTSRVKTRKNQEYTTSKSGDLRSLSDPQYVTMSKEDLISLVDRLHQQIGDIQEKDKDRVSETEQMLRFQLDRCSRNCDSLAQRLESVVADRDAVCVGMSKRDEFHMIHIKRLNQELALCKKHITQLLGEKANSKQGKLNKRLSVSLLKAKQDADKHMSMIMERNEKIDEMCLYIQSESRYVNQLEETIRKMKMELSRLRRDNSNTAKGAGDIVSKWATSEHGLPCRLPGDEYEYFKFSDISNVHSHRYSTGGSTHHHANMADVFGFAKAEYGEYEESPERVFDPTAVPFVRGMVYEEGERMGGLYHDMIQQYKSLAVSPSEQSATEAQ